MRHYSKNKPKKTSKLALVFLIIIGLGMSWYLFNTYIPKTKLPISLYQSQNRIFQKTKAFAYNSTLDLISLIKKNNSILDTSDNQPALIWCRLDEQCYLINNQGIAYQVVQMQFTVSNDLIKIHEAVGQPIVLGEKFIDQELINFIINAKNLMLIRANLQPRDFFMPEAGSSRLDIITWDSQRFIFNTSQNLENQLVLIKQALGKISREDQQSLEYMGVDVSGQVYYKIGN